MKKPCFRDAAGRVDRGILQELRTLQTSAKREPNRSLTLTRQDSLPLFVPRSRHSIRMGTTVLIDDVLEDGFREQQHSSLRRYSICITGIPPAMDEGISRSSGSC